MSQQKKEKQKEAKFLVKKPLCLLRPLSYSVLSGMVLIISFVCPSTSELTDRFSEKLVIIITHRILTVLGTL